MMLSTFANMGKRSFGPRRHKDFPIDSFRRHDVAGRSIKFNLAMMFSGGLCKSSTANKHADINGFTANSTKILQREVRLRICCNNCVYFNAAAVPLVKFFSFPEVTVQQKRYFYTGKGPPRNFFVRLKAKLFPSVKNEQEQLIKSLIAREAKEKDGDAEVIKRDNLRLAFAEGYLSASVPKESSKKTLNSLKFFQLLLHVAAFGALIYMLLTSSVLKQLTGSLPIDPETIHVTFDNVKGVDSAKEELQEVVEFLRNPEKFSRIGGKLPKGVLLVGPPGTGKTLLARALAGEAKVPFFHTCGAEFDEMLVGQGARRVRDLFKTAKEFAPCVIFIDEMDACGSKRTASVLHPHANQTVNQLLTEMDGFNSNEGVIVLAATNRREDLDPALLRPGRFDLQVEVPRPDYTGRFDILVLYLQRLVTGPDVNVDVLARGTIGMTGADLESIVNQAALRAATENCEFVSMSHLEAARDKILMGPEMKGMTRDAETDKITAYHEAGHALVALCTKDAQPLHKVTIVGRGSSLGHTAFIPAKDKYHITKAELLARLDTLMGGRAAEDLILGGNNVTSGAASDLKGATDLATEMVKNWGMSEKVGLRAYSSHELAAAGASTRNIIDSEIKTILDQSYERAKNILKTHAKEHKLLAETLLKYETLNADEIEELLKKFL